MENHQIEQKLIELGGSLWSVPGKRRVYINNVAKWIGVELNYYKTGNISSAKYHGETVSNGFASKHFGQLQFAKLWFDCGTGVYHSTGIDPDDFDYAVQGLRDAMAVEPEPTDTVA